MSEVYSWRTPTSRSEKIAKLRASHARMMAGEGFIYVAEAVGTDIIKLGFSLTPERRVKQVWRYSFKALKGKPFRLLAKVPGSIFAEREMHRQLARDAASLNAGELYRRSILSHPAIPAELRTAA